MEKDKTMAGIMDLCLANGWENARLAKLMNLFVKDRGQKMTYTKGTVAAHVSWRKTHPAKPIEQTPEVIAADLKLLEDCNLLVPVELVSADPEKKVEIIKQPSNKPAKKADVVAKAPAKEKAKA